MKSDKFSQPVLTNQDVINLLYENSLEILDQIIIDPNESVNKLIEYSKISILTTNQIDYSRSVEDFDTDNQSTWFMPAEYKQLDIEEFLVHTCPEENYQRLIQELEAYKARNMLDLLRWLKYFVDTMRQNNIVWGVGRGSSVASYVLYLIGVHKIDSIKYNLDWQEFLR